MVIYILVKNKIPQYLIFRCGMNHLNYSLKKLGRTFKLKNRKTEKTEINHDEITVDNYKDKKDIWVDYVEMMYYVLLYHMLDIVRQWKKLLDLV